MTAAVKPVQQPNLLHQMMLGALLDNEQKTRTEWRGKRDKSGRWIEVPVVIPVPMLAGHVTMLNCERAAGRWLAAVV